MAARSLRVELSVPIGVIVVPQTSRERGAGRVACPNQSLQLPLLLWRPCCRAWRSAGVAEATEGAMAAATAMVAATVITVAAISMGEATTAFAVRISAARATCAVGPPFPVRHRSKARAAARR